MFQSILNKNNNNIGNKKQVNEAIEARITSYTNIENEQMKTFI